MWCFMVSGLKYVFTQHNFYEKIKRCNVTNNHIKPVDQTSREQFLGNTISSVLWGNNMTNIGRATNHSPGNCVRN